MAGQREQGFSWHEIRVLLLATFLDVFGFLVAPFCVAIVRERGKKKRKWIVSEDDELIKALHEVSLDPKWRSDDSFKNGYMLELEARLAEKLLDAKFSAIPHLDSRLRYFKTKYDALEQMLSKSGFTWDDSKKMLQCEKQQYEDHCKNHPDSKGLYGVQFTYYNLLSTIYGKYIATGEGAEDMSDVVNNMEQELVVGAGNDNDEAKEEDRTSIETPRRSFDSTSSSSKKLKEEWKGKGSVSNDPLLDMFNEVSGDLKVVTNSVGKMA